MAVAADQGAVADVGSAVVTARRRWGPFARWAIGDGFEHAVYTERRFQVFFPTSCVVPRSWTQLDQTKVFADAA